MFGNKTNAAKVSLHTFPGVHGEPWGSKWIAFVLEERYEDWIPGTAHLCSNHFAADRYDGWVFFKISITTIMI